MNTFYYDEFLLIVIVLMLNVVCVVKYFELCFKQNVHY